MLMLMFENCLSQPQAQITSFSGQENTGEMYEYIHNRRKVPTETHPELVPKQDDRKSGRDHTQVNRAAQEPPPKPVVLFSPTYQEARRASLGEWAAPAT